MKWMTYMDVFVLVIASFAIGLALGWAWRGMVEKKWRKMIEKGFWE